MPGCAAAARRAMPERPAEVVARGRQRGGLDQGLLVARVAGQRLAQQRVGARVEAGVAGLAHLLQVRGGEGGGAVGPAGAHIALQAGDERVGVGLGADG